MCLNIHLVRCRRIERKREMREIRENNERIMEERGGRGFIFIWGSNAKPC